MLNACEVAVILLASLKIYSMHATLFILLNMFSLWFGVSVFNYN